MLEKIDKILHVAQRKASLDKDNPEWHQWSDTYFRELQSEVEEVKAELKENNSVYLEDELWDVFWDYLNLLLNLEKEWKIDMKNVFHRCEKKFRERVEHNIAWWKWEEIKVKQKRENLDEHNRKHG